MTQAQAQAQMQAKQLLYHNENDLDASINTSTSTRIKIFSFSCAYARACVHLFRVKTNRRASTWKSVAFVQHLAMPGQLKHSLLFPPHLSTSTKWQKLSL